MTYPASTLPDDIVVAIATQLRGDCHTNLRAFVQVNKQWHQVGHPIFCGNVALSQNTLERFTNSFNAQLYGKYVRSMTLRLEIGPSKHPNHYNPGLALLGLRDGTIVNNEGLPYEHSLLPERIARFVRLLPSFTALASFSLRVDQQPYCDFIPRATLVALLEALPESCKNLELDTGEHFYLNSTNLHICEVLRGILPRMHNVRVRLGGMCGAMFGTGKPTSNDFMPIALPVIKTLLVSCSLFGLQAERCGAQMLNSQVDRMHGGDSWTSVIAALTKLTARYGGTMKAASLYVTTVASDNDLKTIIRADMLAKESWAIPALMLPPSKPLFGGLHIIPYLVRLPDDSELVAANWDHVETLIEQGLWKDVHGGARLPAYVLGAEKNGLPSFATGCLEIKAPTRNAETWLLEPSEWAPPTRWQNEEQTQTKIFQAEKRTGSDFPSLAPVENIIPAGWMLPAPGAFVRRVIPPRVRPKPPPPMPSTCSVCLSFFPSKNKLHKHIKSAHPETLSTTG